MWVRGIQEFHENWEKSNYSAVDYTQKLPNLHRSKLTHNNHDCFHFYSELIHHVNYILTLTLLINKPNFCWFKFQFRYNYSIRFSELFYIYCYDTLQRSYCKFIALVVERQEDLKIHNQLWEQVIQGYTKIGKP